MTRTDPTPSTEAECRRCHGDEWIDSAAGIIRCPEECWVEKMLAAARAEGRQQAVREIRDVLADNHNTLGAEHYRLDQIEDVLDRVAGLNASESTAAQAQAAFNEAFFGDASESPATLHAVALTERLMRPEWQVRDVSESGQPPEGASDE